jgi:hypothetical protein
MASTVGFVAQALRNNAITATQEVAYLFTHVTLRRFAGKDR